MSDPVAESLLEHRKLFPALEDCVHFISHSLGCVPAKAADDLAEFFELWRTKPITAWSDWLPEVDRAPQRIAKIIAGAKQVGAHVILDCYQSIGCVPLDVVELGVSFACGGSVKYVCGGPGAAWLYVRKDLIEQFAPRVTGWFGNEAPFAFTMPEQSYADNIWRYMGGTPAVAALYQARAGQRIIGEI